MDKRQEVIKYIASVEKQLYALFGNTYHAALKLTEVRKAIESGASLPGKEPGRRTQVRPVPKRP